MTVACPRGDDCPLTRGAEWCYAGEHGPRVITDVRLDSVSLVSIPPDPNCWLPHVPGDVQAIGNAIMRDGDRDAYAAFGRLSSVMIAAVPYNREALVEILVYHYRTETAGCGCGWAELGRSHAEHVADVYEQSVTT